MEINNSLSNKLMDRTMSVLKKALDYESANQQIISGNMANADTPGYKQMNLRFEEELQRAEGVSGTALNRTDSRHYSGLSTSGSNFTIETTDTDEIDLDSEMAKMTKNNLLYEANSRLLTKKLLALKAAIKGSY